MITTASRIVMLIDIESESPFEDATTFTAQIPAFAAVMVVEDVVPSVVLETDAGENSPQPAGTVVQTKLIASPSMSVATAVSAAVWPTSRVDAVAVSDVSTAAWSGTGRGPVTSKTMIATWRIDPPEIVTSACPSAMSVVPANARAVSLWGPAGRLTEPVYVPEGASGVSSSSAPAGAAETVTRVTPVRACSPATVTSAEPLPGGRGDRSAHAPTTETVNATPMMNRTVEDFMRAPRPRAR